MDDDFVLDDTDNPHPRMLTKALDLRHRARHPRNSIRDRDRWAGYLEAMCDATGETPVAMHAWLDRHDVA